jgi:hypothetical protein
MAPRASWLALVFALALGCIGMARGNQHAGALAELDEAQLCFHEYAPNWWNMLVNVARYTSDSSTRRVPLNSESHLQRLASIVQWLGAAARAGRDPAQVYTELVSVSVPSAVIPPEAMAELPWSQPFQACLRIAHKTGVTAALFNRDEEYAATIQQE